MKPRAARGKLLGSRTGAARAGARRHMAAPPSSRRSWRSLCLAEGPQRGPGKRRRHSPAHTQRPEALGWEVLSGPRRGARGAIEGSARATEPAVPEAESRVLTGPAASWQTCWETGPALHLLGLEPLRQDRPCPPPAASPHPGPAGAPSTLHGGRDQGSRALAPVCVPALLPAGGQNSPAGVTGPQVTTGGTEAGSEFD